MFGRHAMTLNSLTYSIIIPTCHKDLINLSLRYILELRLPKQGYEVLVVHNATKDDIASVVASYKDKIPNLRYIYEPEDGLMAARHRGAKEAQGSILCYLDDDSFVDKNYLVGIEETFSDNSVVCACGPNLPLYESKPPAWLKYFWTDSPWGAWMGQLSLMKLKNKVMDIPAWFAFGCNMAYRKDMFFNLNGTNPDCMPSDKLMYTGDGETALSVKLNTNGYFARYNPKIKIRHFVHSSRMTEKYFVKRAVYQGICDSFTNIRVKRQVCPAYKFEPNSNISIPKEHFLKRKFRKINNKLKNFDFLKSSGYKEYERIKDLYDAALKDSFAKHQEAVFSDKALLEWVLKEHYL